MENKRQLPQYKYRKCAICGVRKLPKSKLLLSSFPLDPDRCRSWVKATGDEDLVHLPIEKLHELKFLCAAHFTPDCINSKGSRLHKTAVPTINLTRPLLSDDLLHEFPLHVKSFYDKEKKIGFIKPRNVVFQEKKCRISIPEEDEEYCTQAQPSSSFSLTSDCQLPLPTEIKTEDKYECQSATSTQATSMDEPQNSAAVTEVFQESHRNTRDVSCQVEDQTWSDIEALVKRYKEYEAVRQREIADLHMHNASLKIEREHIERSASRDSDHAFALRAKQQNLAVEENNLRFSLQRLRQAIEVIRNY